MDPITATLMTFGIILLISSWIQLMFVSFGDDYSWGLTTLFIPFIAYLYGLWAWEKSKGALKMAAIGSVLILAALI